MDTLYEYPAPMTDSRTRPHILYRNNQWHIYWNWFSRGYHHWGVRFMRYYREFVKRWRQALIIDWGWGELVIAREKVE